MNVFWITFTIVIFLLVLAGITAVVLAYFKDLRLAHWHLAALGSRVVATSCGPIEAACRGEGYPMLVVHGAMGGFDHGLWLAQTFNASGYEVISISRFGYLRSPVPPDASLNLQADLYASLLEALEVPKAVVFAISAGSTSAIRFAARYPDKVTALVLVGPDSPGREQMQMPPRFVFNLVLRSDLLYWLLITFFGKAMRDLMGLAPKGFALRPENKALMKQFLRGALPVSARVDGLIYDSYIAVDEFNESVTERSPHPLGTIKTPVLVVNTLDDPLALAENVQALAGLIPNARRYVVPDGGHLFFGHMDEVRSVINQFLSNILGKQEDRQ